MAKLAAGIEFTGPMGGFTAYRMKGSDSIILRRKGGLTKKQVKRMKPDSTTRLNNLEWSGCVKAGHQLRRALHGVRHLADYNITGDLHKLAKTFQKMDQQSPAGRRAIRFTNCPHGLVGFSLNKTYLFDQAVKHPLTATLDRDNGEAHLQIPALLPGIHLNISDRWPLYRFRLSVGMLRDIVFDERLMQYAVQNTPDQNRLQITDSGWHPVNESFAGEKLQVTLPQLSMPDQHGIYLLCAGIERGIILADGSIEPVAGAGSAKVMAAG